MVAGAADACFGPSGSGPVHRERVNAGGSVNQSGHMRAGDAPGHHTAPDIATEGTVRRDGSRVHHGRVARRVRMRHRIAKLSTRCNPRRPAPANRHFDPLNTLSASNTTPRSRHALM